MTQALGTALGVALVTLTLHLNGESATPAWLTLLAAAVGTAAATAAARPARHHPAEHLS